MQRKIKRKHYFKKSLLLISVGTFVFAIYVFFSTPPLHGDLSSKSYPKSELPLQLAPQNRINEQNKKSEESEHLSIIQQKTSPQKPSHQKTVQQWVDYLLTDLSDEHIIALPSTLLYELTVLAKEQNTVYAQLLEHFAELDRSEKKLFLQKVLRKGNNEQKRFAIDTLLYSGKKDNEQFAVTLAFNLDNQEQTANLITGLFTTEQDPSLSSVLLLNLANENNRALTDLFSSDLEQLYTFSEYPTIKQQALRVLFTNTSTYEKTVTDFLEQNKPSETLFVLQIAKDIRHLYPEKVGSLERFKRQLQQIAADPNQSAKTRALADSLLMNQP